MQTTFRKLKKAGACTERYEHLARKLGGTTEYGRDTPITALQILDICGLDDLWWAWRLFDKPTAGRVGRLLAADFASRAWPAYRKKYPTDKRPLEAIKAARAYARGEIDDAARAAAAGAAAGAAARAAAAWEAVDPAVGNAAWAAVWAAARDDVGPAVGIAAWVAAGAAARAAEREWQASRVRLYLKREGL